MGFAAGTGRDFLWGTGRRWPWGIEQGIYFGARGNFAVVQPHRIGIGIVGFDVSLDTL